jgi:hypothetical protein
MMAREQNRNAVAAFDGVGALNPLASRGFDVMA